jgi:MFS family permease
MTVAIYMITYMDRTIIASAMPLIRKEFGFSLITAGWILASFRWGFTLFQLPGAWFGDKIGPRRALAIIVTWWSIFTSLTTLAWGAASMVVVRFVFGIGESGAFPIATRSPLALLALTLIALSLDAPRRTRLRARHRLSPRRRCHSPAGGLDDSA